MSGVDGWSPEELDSAVDAYLMRGESSAAMLAAPKTGASTATASRASREDDLVRRFPSGVSQSASDFVANARDLMASTGAPARSQPVALASSASKGNSHIATQQQQQHQRTPYAARVSVTSAALPPATSQLDDLVDSLLGPSASGHPSPALGYSAARGAVATGQSYDDDALTGATPLHLIAAQALREAKETHYVAGEVPGQPDFRGSSVRSGSTAHQAAVDTQLMLRRMNMWRARKERNIDAKRREHDARVMEECTFRPLASPELQQQAQHASELLAPSSLYRDNKAWGTDEYLERQEAARRLREEKRQHEEHVFASGAAWRHQSTVPKPFSLGSHRHRAPSSMADGGAANGRAMASVGSGSSRGMAPLVASLRQHFEVAPSRIEAPSLPPGAFSSVKYRGASVYGTADDVHGATAWASKLDAMVDGFL
jgi:hypothetical protein